MRNNLKIGVIGTGGVGGYYGSQLQKQGFDVHYLLNSDFEYVKTHGLKVLSPNGDYSFNNVNAYQSVHEMPKCDILILALKTTSNHLLSELLPPALKDDGFVFALQNGIGIEQQIAQIVGPNRVIGGLCFICSIKKGPGVIEHQDYGWMSVGDYRENNYISGLTDRIKMIAEMFDGTGIPIDLMEDLTLARWQKLIFNIPFNGLSVVLGANTKQLTSHPDIRELAWQLMLEVGITAKSSVNRVISEDFMQDILHKTTVMQPFDPSMKQDHDANRPLEIEAIHGQVVRHAKAAGIQVPKIETLYQQLKFINDDS
ncbi:2-dehydropantoate 2-reductase [Poriferisphaera corsica]|uniref:2-dehydropantoate 2-reductase n=1 Tax=Poriferisphaera corsica TaxID=2528020 RepID=A0A517YUF1_9BACT|nr:putative 2-dehydropantoate 2-reductase [Poriferisphaera corsica]QDU33848.1 2-dehydropantoate 2-reductase [Poriferisphaera corsica]